MTGGEAALLAAGGTAAGAINAVAGGGSLVSFPALLLAGYGSLTANVTNSIAVTPGYLASSYGYRARLTGQAARVARFGGTVAAGALVGTVLLLVAPASTFDAIVPFLVLIACGLLAAQPRLARRREARGAGHAGARLDASLFLASIYGGYFGAGLGIVFLALLGTFIPDDLQRLNALKGVLSLVVATAAAISLALFGPVAWPAAAVVAVGSLAGGRIGAVVAQRLPPDALRRVIVAYGVVVAIILLLR